MNSNRDINKNKMNEDITLEDTKVFLLVLDRNKESKELLCKKRSITTVATKIPLNIPKTNRLCVKYFS